MRLTTAPFNGDLSIDRRIVRRLQRLAAAGWVVRMAGPRNYTAWRHSSALAKAAPVIVLPNGEFRFNQDERNVAVLHDLVIAELRMQQGNDAVSDERVREVMIVVASALFPMHATDAEYLGRILHQVERKTRNALAGAPL